MCEHNFHLIKLNFLHNSEKIINERTLDFHFFSTLNHLNLIDFPQTASVFFLISSFFFVDDRDTVDRTTILYRVTRLSWFPLTDFWHYAFLESCQGPEINWNEKIRNHNSFLEFFLQDEKRNRRGLPWLSFDFLSTPKKFSMIVFFNYIKGH